MWNVFRFQTQSIYRRYDLFQTQENMTKIELLWFKCPRCSKSFLSYVEGKPIYDDCPDGICFNDEDLGEIHNNHYLNTIPNKRECRKCRKCLDLLSFQ